MVSDSTKVDRRCVLRLVGGALDGQRCDVTPEIWCRPPMQRGFCINDGVVPCVMASARYLNPKGVVALNRTLTLQVTALLTWSFHSKLYLLVNLAPMFIRLTVHKGLFPHRG